MKTCLGRLYFLFLPAPLSAVVCSLTAQTNFQTLKSFDYPPESSANLYDQVILASDGLLYGSTYKGGSNNVGTVFKISTAGTGYIVIRHMMGAGGDGRFPRSGLVEAGDGFLYGTTEMGGSNGRGAIYKLAKDGSGYAVLYSFGATGADGQNPYGRLILASDGMLYGTTFAGGTTGEGTVFRIGTNGADYTLLLNLGGSLGGSPYAGVIEGTDGALYGTADRGGLNFSGTVFKLNKDGSDATVLRSFGSNSDGYNVRGRILEGIDGALYGTTFSGGTNFGSVFKLNKDGSGFVRLHAFSQGFYDEKFVYAGLVQGSDGILYGTAPSGGGTNKFGCVFKINTNGTGYTIVRAFDAGESGNSQARLIQGPDGVLYGTSVSGGTQGRGTVFKINTNGSGFTVLRSMVYTGRDGFLPSSELEEGTDGFLYGTTFEGGTNDLGTVFRMSKDGSGFLVLRDFTSGSGGQKPFAGVIQGSDGFLYGTTIGGGSIYGVIFKLNTNGSGYTAIHTFTSSTTNGTYPYGQLIEGSDGNLYGTTYQGGNSPFPTRGTIYRIAKNGAGFTLLRSFQGGASDGSNPYAGVTEASDGFLYGTTYSGGLSNRGTIFKIDKAGSNYSVLLSLGATSIDGQSPYAGLVEASDGFLYGTTLYGGSTGVGTVFKINKSGGGYASLHSFNSSGVGGYNSYGRVVEGNDGSLFGTTYLGGANGFGVIFKINKDGGNYTAVRHFTGTNGEGENPYAGMIKGSDGGLYGMTQYGGISDVGTVFRLTGAAVSAPALAGSYSQETDKFTVTFTGSTGAVFELQATANFGMWTNIATLTNVSGQTAFTDNAPANPSMRFYRARQLP